MSRSCSVILDLDRVFFCICGVEYLASGIFPTYQPWIPRLSSQGSRDRGLIDVENDLQFKVEGEVIRLTFFLGSPRLFYLVSSARFSNNRSKSTPCLAVNCNCTWNSTPRPQKANSWPSGEGCRIAKTGKILCRERGRCNIYESCPLKKELDTYKPCIMGVK